MGEAVVGDEEVQGGTGVFVEEGCKGGAGIEEVGEFVN